MTDGSVWAGDAGPRELSMWNRVVVNYFEDCATDYRRMWGGPSALSMHMGYWTAETRKQSEALIEMNRQMADRVWIQPGMSVLDAGCGIGGSSIWLAEDHGVNVTGINICQRDVVNAQQNAHERGLSGRARFLCRDFVDTGFDDAMFDIVWAQEAVAHSPDKEACEADRQPSYLTRRAGRSCRGRRAW